MSEVLFSGSAYACPRRWIDHIKYSVLSARHQYHIHGFPSVKRHVVFTGAPDTYLPQIANNVRFAVAVGAMMAILYTRAPTNVEPIKHPAPALDNAIKRLSA